MEVSKATYIFCRPSPPPPSRQGTIERLNGDPVIVKPTAKATHEALCIRALD